MNDLNRFGASSVRMSLSSRIYDTDDGTIKIPLHDHIVARTRFRMDFVGSNRPDTRRGMATSRMVLTIFYPLCWRAKTSEISCGALAREWERRGGEKSETVGRLRARRLNEKPRRRDKKRAFEIVCICRVFVGRREKQRECASECVRNAREGERIQATRAFLFGKIRL